MCRWTHAVQTRVAQGSTVLVTVSPPHPTPLESGDVNPPCHHPLILLHQQQCHPSVLQKQYCISLPSIRAPTKFKAGNKQSLVLAEGKTQPEELYILSRPHPRPRPARGQEDSRQSVSCCYLRPQPTLCAIRDDNVSTDNSSAQPAAGPPLPTEH